MLTELKNLIRAIIPNSIFKLLQPIYHGLIAQIAAIYFGNPSQDLFVIGVTGTAGKSTTIMMLSWILNNSGKQTGYITTVGSFDGHREQINKHGLSMPGGWQLQKLMHEYALKGCKYVIVECTSEGLAQNRHLGINFRAALFTNLSPAHLDAHGSFDKYREAKGKLFQNLTADSIIGVNTDDPNYGYFYNFPSRKKFGVSTREDKTVQFASVLYKGANIQVDEGVSFDLDGQTFHLPLKGSFNVSNALLAIGLAKELGVETSVSNKALAGLGKVPGRMEVIENDKNATIIVDYAPEPAAMESSLQAARLIPHNRIIHVFGSTGGHRDVSKRFEFGRISARYADIIIITNDDVYDSDPKEIAVNIQEGISEVEKSESPTKEIIVELDRKQALSKAISMLQPKDLLLVTGKGSEQFLVLPGNERVEWDDRKVIRELLQ